MENELLISDATSIAQHERDFYVSFLFAAGGWGI
jgi:hypothetical protein